MPSAGSEPCPVLYSQISIMQWHQKISVLVQIRTLVTLVTNSHSDHVWAFLTTSIFMELNKVCLFLSQCLECRFFFLAGSICVCVGGGGGWRRWWSEEVVVGVINSPRCIMLIAECFTLYCVTCMDGSIIAFENLLICTLLNFLR